MWTLIIGIAWPLRITVLKIMKTTTKPEINLNDETEGEDVPKAFIAGCNEGPVPLMEWTGKEIVLMETEDYPAQSPVHVIVAGVNASDPNSIDILGINVPNTEKILVEPNRIDILEDNVPNTDNIPIDPETSIVQPLSSTAVKVLAGAHVPIIDIILNSAGIMSIREHTHSRGRIELYFATTHSSYFLFACLMTPKLHKPVYNIPIEPMIVKKERRTFHKRSTIVWADLRYGILSIDHDWSPIRRFGVFNTMSRRESDEEDIPLDYLAEVQRACRLIANFMFVLARAIICMLDLLVFVSLSFLVVAGGTRFISHLSGSFIGMLTGRLCMFPISARVTMS